MHSLNARPEVQASAVPDLPLLTVDSLTKHFVLSSKDVVRAVDGVSLNVGKGEILGIVGESGCGKSTTSRLIMGLSKPTSGRVFFEGRAVAFDGPMRDYRRNVQMVFQDSYASLNPRMTIEQSIAFAPRVHGVSRQASLKRAHDLLNDVGLQPRDFARRYPHELSGGQRQRVNIARALALEPKLLILDEPVSALDKSVEAQVLNLLMDLRHKFELTYIFISHDLNVVQYMADRVLVMYLGQVAEFAEAERLFAGARHPYSAALLASRLTFDPENRRRKPPLVGDPPNPINPPSGCRFRTRCAFAEPVCAQTVPPLTAVDAHQSAACLMALAGSGHSRAETPA